MITTVTPFPVDWLELAWHWFNEFPDANMDDFAPKSFDAFYSVMRQRLDTDKTWGIVKDSMPCGYVGVTPLAPHSYSTHTPPSEFAVLHGICFARGFCNHLEKRRVMMQILDELFSQGLHKISASYFTSNRKIGPFLLDLGFHTEGRLSEQTKQHGKWIDMQLVARIEES